MPSKPYILASVLLLMVISACQNGGPAPSTPPAASATPQLAVESDKAFSTTQVVEPSMTASLTVSITPVPESTATATSILPATVSPLMIAPENADEIQELVSLGGSEIGVIIDVAWSPNGEYLGVIGSKSLILIDAASMEIIWRVPITSARPELMFIADSRMLIVDAGNGYAIGVDVEQGEILHEVGVDGIFAVNPAGNLFASTRGGDVELFDWQTDQLIGTLDADMNSGAVSDLAFSADGKTLIAGSDHGDVQTWDVNSGYRAPTYFPSIPSELYFCEVSGAIAGMPGGNLLVVCHSPTSDYGVDNVQIWLWDADEVQNRKYIRTQENSNRNFSHFTVSADGQRLAVFAGEDLEVWNAAGGYPINTLSNVQGEGLAFNPAESGTLAVWTDSTIQIWDIVNGQLMIEFDEPGSIAPVTRLAFNPASPGRQLVIGRSDGLVELWDVSSGQEASELVDLPDSISGLSFNADGSLLALSSLSKAVQLWDFDNEIPQLQAEIETSDEIYAIALDPEGNTLAVAGDSEFVDIWELSTQTIIHSLRTTSYENTSLAISDDGKTLAVGNPEGVVYLWSLEHFTLLEKMDTRADSEVVGLAFSTDGTQLAILAGRRFQVWDAEGGEWIRGWTAQSGDDFVAYSPDQCTLVISGSSLEFLDIHTGDFYLGFIESTGNVPSLSFSPDGYLLAGGSDGGHVGILGVPGGLDTPASMEIPEIRCGSLVALPTATPTQTSTATTIPSPTQTPSATPIPTATTIPTLTPSPTMPPFDQVLFLSEPPMQGDDILLVQQRLLALGYTEVGIADGVFGPLTDQAVRHFQELNGLEIDGVVGPNTWDQLFGSEAVGTE